MTTLYRLLSLAALGAIAVAPGAFAQAPAPAARPVQLSPAFERAILAELDAPTRAEVERRATAGNTVSGVIATMLLNDNQLAAHGAAGAVQAVAIDFVRGAAVLRGSNNELRLVPFNPQTLRVGG